MRKLITFLLVSFLVTTKLFGTPIYISIGDDINSKLIGTSGIITLQFARGGTWGSFAFGGDYTIAVPSAVTQLTLTYDPATSGAAPVLNLNTITYLSMMTGGLTIDGLKVITPTTNRYLISAASSNNFPATVTIQNSWIEGYRGVFVLGSYTNTITQVTLTNSTFKTIGLGGIISTASGTPANDPTVNNISITNNTFIDCNAAPACYFIDHRSSKCINTIINFSNNTVYYPKGQFGNGFIRITGTGVTANNYNFNNNLFAAGISGTTFKFGYGSYTGFAGTGNYFSSILGTAVSSTNSVTFTKYTENTPSNLFRNPYAFDFTIDDQIFTAKTTVGNPSCYAPVLSAPNYSISTSVKLSTGVVSSAAGTVSPAATTENSGTSITFTATRNLGYTFKEWDDGSGNLISTNNPYTTAITGNMNLVAVFNASLIAAWDFNATSTTAKDRPGDYYYNSSNKGVMRLYETDNITDIVWTNTSMIGMSATDISVKTGARRNTIKTDILAGKCRYFQAEVSTKGYKSVQVKSKIAYDNNTVFKAQKLQYSTDGTNYTDLTTISDISVSPSHSNYWMDLNGTLPSSCDNQSIVYFRWTNAGTTQVAASGSETIEDFYLTDVEITGTFMAPTAANGDYIATVSGDVNTATNWIVWGGTTGTAATAITPPTNTTNLWIPAGITMANSASANCNDLYIAGAYTASATLGVNGNLTIKSDVSGTGTILDNGNLIVTANTNVQQYLKAGRNWYLSSPVSGATSSVFNAAAASNINQLYWYDETNGISATLNWPQITNNATSLVVGKGYVANVGASLLSAINGITFTGGSLNTGDITTGVTVGVPALTSTSAAGQFQGYNLVGNPYPSYLNAMTAINNSNTAAGSTVIDPTIWYRTLAGGDYYFETVNTISGIGTDDSGTGTVTGYIPPMQAFWVHVAYAPASLTFNNSMRTHAFKVTVDGETIPTTLLKAPSAQNTLQQIVRLKVSNGINEDETVLYFNTNASNGFDKYDSRKMSNNNPAIPEIYTAVGSNKLVINGMNSVTPNAELPLGFTTGQSNSFTIKASEITNLDSNIKVYLKDKLLGTEQDLTDGIAYTFASDVASTTDRFSVVFKSAGVATGLDAATGEPIVLIYKNANNQIAVNCKGDISSDAVLSVYNALGQKLEIQKITSTMTVTGKSLTSGMYVVTVNNGGKITAKKVILN